MTATEGGDGGVTINGDRVDENFPLSGERSNAEPARAQEQEPLYVVWNRCHDGCWDYDYPDAPTKPDHQCYNLLPYPVTKVTARRIYFHDAGRPHRRYFISRDAFEVDEDGDTTAWHRGLCERLYVNRPTWHIRPQPKTIADLRREMADAHPDRGGDRDRFATARRRYLVARGAGPRS